MTANADAPTDYSPVISDASIKRAADPNVPSFALLIRNDQVDLAPRMLDTQDKEKIAHTGQEFTLVALKRIQDEEGEYWAHGIILDGEPVTFRLNTHPSRDRTAEQLSEAVKAYGAVKGITLLSLAQKMGNHFLVLAPVVDQ